MSQNSEAHYRSLFVNMQVGLAYCRMIYENGKPFDFIYLEVNPAFERLTGLKNVTGKKVSEVIPEIRASDPELFAIYGRVAAGAPPEQFELHLRALDMWFSVFVHSPAPEHFVALFDVVTEKKRAEAALRESEEFNRRIIASSSDCIKVLDREGNLLSMSEAGQRLLEIDDIGPYINHCLIGFWQEQDQPTVSQAIATARAGGYSHFQGYRPSEKGTPKWWDVVISPIVGEDGKTERLLAVSRDITERIQAQETLRQSEQRFKTLAAGTFEGIAISAQGKLLDVNDRLTQMLGYERCDMIGRAVKDFIPREDHDRVMANIHAGRESQVEHEMLCKDGSRRIVEAHGQTIAQEGLPIRLTAIRDITERRKAADELRAAKAEAERANNAKSRFLAAASHDLRQPLSALGLYVGVLKNKLAPADAPLLSNMRNCVSSLSELLTDLLDLSKLDAGVVTPEVSDFAVADLLANLVSVHAPEALLKGLRLRCLSSDLTARTDPVLFRRLLGNLIANAIRYTESGGVLIGCRRRQGKAWIEVWDTGIGIPEEKISEIFEEFRQLGHDERNRGSGLGLAIVARSAALLGLQIRVRSRPGKGSLFAVELPLGMESKAEVRREAKPRPLRIALVDDNAGVLSALACALEEIGHQVVTAATGDELLGRLGDRPPDVVISDYRLAGRQTGFDVIAAARAAFGDQLPALLITGDTDPKLMRSMADRGIVVQHKPLDIEALQLCIEHVTNRRWS